jgi:hypothetical protein
MKIKNHSRNEKYVGFVEKKKKKKKKKKKFFHTTTGAGESGKSTVLKQVKNVYKIPFNKWNWIQFAKPFNSTACNR